MVYQGFLINSERKRFGPELIDLSITSICNHKCYFCDEHSYLLKSKNKPTTLNDSTVEHLFREFKKLRVKKVTLAGNGEQLMLPITSKMILKYGKSIEFQIATNGSSLYKIDEKLYDNLSKITVSINSVNNKTHKLIHGYASKNDEGQLPEILKELNRLLKFEKSENKILVSYAISKDNINEIEELFNFVKSTNCDFSIRPVHLIFNEMQTNNVGLSLEERIFLKNKIKNYMANTSDERLINIWNYTLDKFNEYEEMVLPEHLKKLKPCYSGFRLINIWSDGQVHQCAYSSYSLGNIYENSFTHIWNSKAMKDNLTKAATMHETNNPPYSHCAQCLEIQGNSVLLNKFMKFIPIKKIENILPKSNISSP